MIFSSSTSGAASAAPLAPDVASQIYTWADRPSHAVVLRNIHLANISLLGGQTTSTIGLPIYQHGQRPCLFATIAGIIVSVTEKDHRWDYLIDDGTCVIDVAIHERDVPASIATLQVRHYGPSSSRLTLDEQPSRLFPTLDVGDLVQVTGKIWRRPLAKAGEAPRFRNGLDAHEVALLNDDPTAEARHNLRAHQLLAGEYARPFEAPIQSYSTIHVQLPGDVRGIFTERLADRFNYDLRRLGGLDEEEEEDDRKPNLDTHLPFRRVPKAERLAARAKRTKARERATPLPSPSPVATPPTSQRGSAPSTPPRLHAPSRQLRTPSKLRDSQCNQSNFRLYVQQFLRDYCQRRWRSEAPLPPAFTIAFLMRVQTLRDLAERTVNGLLAGRKSREPREEKVKRLYEYCIRQLVQDGVLVIADEEAAWPFDGSNYGDVAWTRRRTRAESKLLKQLGGGRHSQQQHRPPQWADVSMPLQEDGCENTTSTRKRVRRDAEAYQYVTPLLLLVPLLPILAGGHDDAEMDVDVDWAVWKLKRSDQRWAHIGVDAVKEALTLIARREA